MQSVSPRTAWARCNWPLGANSYTSLTTINKGTLQLTAANSLTGNTAVTIANDATAKLDLNGFDTSLGGLSGGGRPGTVAMGTGTSPSTGSVQRHLRRFIYRHRSHQLQSGRLRLERNHANAHRAGLYRRCPDGCERYGNAFPHEPHDMGLNDESHYVASINSSSAGLTVGANATLAADNLVLAGNLYTSETPTTGGAGALNVNAATSKVTANTLNFGMSLLPFDSVSQNPPAGVLPPTFKLPSPTATATLSNGTIELAGTNFANGYTYTPCL